MIEKSFEYFQYVTQMDCPIFLRCERPDSTEQAQALQDFLEQQQFCSISYGQFQHYSNAAADHYRVLTIRQASARVARHLGHPEYSEGLQREQIIAQKGHWLYRLVGHGVMVYSRDFADWELGLCRPLGDSASHTIHRIILNRFLAWALAPLGICGFWGVCCDEGVVVMKKTMTLGEACFLDLGNDCLISSKGVKTLDANFCFIRLSSSLREGRRMMSAEQLLSFLSAHCAFFQQQGESRLVRQMIEGLCLNYRGRIYPRAHLLPQDPFTQKIVAV